MIAQLFHVSLVSTNIQLLKVQKLLLQIIFVSTLSFWASVVRISSKLPQSIVEDCNTAAFLHRLGGFDLHFVNDFALSEQE